MSAPPTTPPRSMLAARVAATPDKRVPALPSDRTVTFSEFEDRSGARPERWHELGVRAGERVLIGMRTGSRPSSSSTRSPSSARSFVPLVPGLEPEELLWQCSHSAAQTLVADPSRPRC